MPSSPLPGRLSVVARDGELPRREDLATIFAEIDFQQACQVDPSALPLVSYAQWQKVHAEVFEATSSDVVHYVSYADRLGLITANATTPYILNFYDLGERGPLVIELPSGTEPLPDTEGFHVQRSTGLNIMFGFRTLDPDPVRAQALVDAIRGHSYAQRDDPPAKLFWSATVSDRDTRCLIDNPQARVTVGDITPA
jgi:hypothetical protein